jgi:hypothetical protein
MIYSFAIHFAGVSIAQMTLPLETVLMGKTVSMGFQHGR